MKFELPKHASILQEIIIIFLLVVTFNNILGRFDEVIVSDGVGYYDYNPSLFIHHDLNRQHYNTTSNPEIFSRVLDIGNHIYVDYQGKPLNKYSVGTSLLQFPFFAFTYVVSKGQVSGYEPLFQNSIFAATLFYLFLILVFFRKLLRAYKIRNPIILFSQICLVFASSLTHYANAEASFSHVYSLFAITAFLYFIKSLIDTYSVKYIYLSAAFLGLILLIRPVNGIVIFALPFITGSLENTKMLLSYLWNKLVHSGLASLLLLLIVSFQFVVWYLQTGDWILYSYQGEGFDFKHPEFYNILFSFRKGLFIYTPLMLFGVIAAFYLFFNRHIFKALTWMGFFILLTFILSSWWSWFYGVSYGLRAYIDFYTILLLPFAFCLNEASRSFQLILGLAAFSCIPLNLIQDYQYTNYIIDGYEMDFNKYKRVFLQTGKQYSGLVSKRKYEYAEFDTISKINLSDLFLEPNSSINIGKWKVDSLPNVIGATMIQISFKSIFLETMTSRCELLIVDSKSGKQVYKHAPFLLHFSEVQSDMSQVGLYNFEILEDMLNTQKILELSFYSDKNELNLNDFVIYFLKQKNF